MTDPQMTYRRVKVGDKGHQVVVRLLTKGRGFVWEVEDSKTRLIRRDTREYETPGEAEEDGSDWITYNLVNL